MQPLLPLSLLAPLLLALLFGGRLRRLALVLVPAAILPALVLSAFPGLVMELPWLLLGMRLGVDEIGVLFLLLAGLLWTVAGVYGLGYLSDDPQRHRFQFFYLLTFTGNLGAILALDVVSFYCFFALMTFSAYGLIVHDGSDQAHRAGRVYLIMAVFGEALLITALLLIASTIDDLDLRLLGAHLAVHPQRDLIMGLILAGFGIKMGAVPLHVWLALAHPYAPTPASAVLSGIIIKAGLLGWLRFLPLGEMTLPGWGLFCLIVGLGSAFYGVLAGLPQIRPKTVLAYSSISQMGLVTALLGIALIVPEHWPLLLSIMLVFCLHHGLAKAALFLGVGITAKAGRWAGWCLALPALALAGAPLTSGALAKLLLKDAFVVAPPLWADWLSGLLTASSVATSLLMARFLYLAWPRQQQGAVSAWLALPWLGLLAAVALLPWWWAEEHIPGVVERTLAWKLLWGNLWPVAAAAALAVLVGWLWRMTGFRLRAPEGDILFIFTWLARTFPRGTPANKTEWVFEWGDLDRAALLLERGERRLRLWNVAGLLVLLLATGLMVLLWGWG